MKRTTEAFVAELRELLSRRDEIDHALRRYRDEYLEQHHADLSEYRTIDHPLTRRWHVFIGRFYREEQTEWMLAQRQAASKAISKLCLQLDPRAYPEDLPVDDRRPLQCVLERELWPDSEPDFSTLQGRCTVRRPTPRKREFPQSRALRGAA